MTPQRSWPPPGTFRARELDVECFPHGTGPASAWAERAREALRDRIAVSAAPFDALVAAAGDQTRSTIDSTAGSSGPGRTTKSGSGGAS